ncbi:MAG: family 10 glycosylhydrolase [Armatimonadota bacterium]
MWARLTATGVALILTCAPGHTADVALVRATLSLERHPTSGIDTYYEAVKRGLDANAVEYDIVTDEQIVDGALGNYTLAIFPFTIDTTPEHSAAILQYIASGGRVMWFFSVPAALQEALGIAATRYRRNEYPDQLHTMVFVEDAPPGFPERIRQQSMSCEHVTALTADARLLADWVDGKGRSTGTPAVILTDHSLYVAHVLWPDADTAAQHHLLLATIGHFVPGAWERTIENALAGALAAVGHASLDALETAAADGPAARGLVAQARQEQERSRAALAHGRYSDALAAAQQFGRKVQSAVAATYPSRPFEMRGAWMGMPRDGTDWDAIMADLKRAHFTAIFPNMCTPGSAAYPSEYLPQVTETDQMSACLAAARAYGIEVHVWRANWQVYNAPEGLVDRWFADGRFVLSVEQAMGEQERDTQYVWSRRWLDPSDGRNRQLEIDAMVELAEKYHPDGIHYDFMRYPSNRYCYCDRCRRQFEEWAGVTVENWPADCWEGGRHLARYRDWRRHLQTSLVAQVRQRLAAIDPNIRISLAARASVTGAPENDAQDWITWAREGYLDFLCPMDYTGSVEAFRATLEPQVAVIDGLIPLYAGIGVSPTRSATAANLSEQIMASRELGADGFLIFSLTGFSRDLLPAIALGATATPVDALPHHEQSAIATFAYPPGMTGAPPRAYPPDAPVEIAITVSARGEDVAQISAQPLLMPARGGEANAVAPYTSVDARTVELSAPVQAAPGVYSVIVHGEVVFNDGNDEPFYLRSRPITILTPERQAEVQARMTPPRFETEAVHVGVVSGGYGSEAILQALSAAEGIEARAAHQVTAQFLQPCDVVILPQLRQGAQALPAGAADALRAFVHAGGGLLVTHDAVGVRGYDALFPQVATGGERVRETEVSVAMAHPIAAGVGVGESFAHSYYDHIQLQAGEAGTTLVVDAGGRPVVVAGEVGEGRFVAWGMATGLGAGDAELAPSGHELHLLVNAVRWLADRG